jgi:TolA-binding protein
MAEMKINVDLSDKAIELLANLANRVHSLEQQLRDTQGNVEKLAEELANTKHRVSKHANMFGIVEEKVGMLTDDILTLDERSQVLNAINKYYAECCR